MKLLVSVKNTAEALEAVEGGGHIIDVKNPDEGALGANFPWVIRRVREVVPNEIEVSATIGDLPNLPGASSLAALGAAVSGADYVKASLFGVKTPSEAAYLIGEVCRAAKEHDGSTKVIAAGYADYAKIGCLSPLEVPAVAHEAGADGAMIDVNVKTHGGLFELLSDEELRGFVEESHRLGLTAFLAGSLDMDDMARVFGLGADIVGVRRAVCRGKDRLKGAVHREAVGELAEEIRRLQGSIKL
ncbi:MAG: (5-formylfuran-3-yl)methyl phosphate synthase [bacterium]